MAPRSAKLLSLFPDVSPSVRLRLGPSMESVTVMGLFQLLAGVLSSFSVSSLA